MPYLFIAAGIYLVSFAFIMDTKDLKSGVIFRILPGLIGMGNLIAGLKTSGLI